MKKIFTKERMIFAAVIVALCAALAFTIKSKSTVEQDWKTSVANNKAYQEKLDSIENRCGVFTIRITELTEYNSELSSRLESVEKENGIKDKQIKHLQRMESEFNKKDTVIVSDTIFKEPDFVLDTMLGDKWVSNRLHMEYPSLISIGTQVKSDKVVTIYTSKETVEKPKKFFICRWFQKKHVVVRVVVDENNPYIQNENNEFYNIEK